MRSITLRAPAKINLGLVILRKLPTGYHEVKTIYSQISLFDVLKIREIDKDKIEVYCDSKDVPADEENLAFQAADLIKKQSRIKKGIKVFIKKRIPIGSALGGGSSDAAAVLKGLSQLWQLDLSLVQLIKLAKNIGADVAYQLVGGIKLEFQGGRRAGKFVSFKNLPICFLVICVPDIIIKSPNAYSQVEYDKIGKSTLASLIKGLESKDLKEIGGGLYNDFELWTFKKYPVIRKIKELMIECRALGSLMSGKGSAVFGLFDKKNTAQKAFELMKKDYPKTFLVESHYGGSSD